MRKHFLARPVSMRKKYKTANINLSLQNKTKKPSPSFFKIEPKKTPVPQSTIQTWFITVRNKRPKFSNLYYTYKCDRGAALADKLAWKCRQNSYRYVKGKTVTFGFCSVHIITLCHRVTERKVFILHEAEQLNAQDMQDMYTVYSIVREVEILLPSGFLRRKISAFITQRNY